MAGQQHSLEIWQSLDQLLAECNALRTSPSHALLLIRNKELVARAVQDQKGLLDATKVLSKDVREYSDKLAEIHKKHADLVQSTNGNITLTPDLTASIMSIGEEYSNWITSYQLVVIPSAFQVTGYFDPALAVEALPQAPALSI
ncbi:hypothetical protein D3C86_921670 [compost metagenome]